MKMCKAAFLARALSGSDTLTVPDSVVSNTWLRVIAITLPTPTAYHMMAFIFKNKPLQSLKEVTLLSQFTPNNQIGYQGG